LVAELEVAEVQQTTNTFDLLLRVALLVCVLGFSRVSKKRETVQKDSLRFSLVWSMPLRKIESRRAEDFCATRKIELAYDRKGNRSFSNRYAMRTWNGS
jgi:hypothetical protein